MQRVLERLQKRVAKRACRNVSGPAVHSAFGLPMSRKVLQRRHYSPLVAKRRITLKSMNGGDAHAPCEIGIFAERLLDATPPRVTRHVHDRSERLVRTAETSLLGGHGVQRLDQRGIERGRQRDGLWK